MKVNPLHDFWNRQRGGVPIGADRNPTPNDLSFMKLNTYGDSSGGTASAPIHTFSPLETAIMP
jgi:hypothetical protein